MTKDLGYFETLAVLWWGLLQYPELLQLLLLKKTLFNLDQSFADIQRYQYDEIDETLELKLL